MKKIFTLIIISVFSIKAFSQDHFLLGNQQFIAGKYKEAVDEYLQALLTKDSANAELYFNIGMAKKKLGLFDEAISYLTTAVNIKSDYKLAWYERGLAKENKGDHTGAIADYSQALELSEQYQDARFERGYSKTNAGDYEGAIKDFTYYINQNGTKLANAYYERAAAKNRSYDYAGALADLEKATEYGLRDKRLYFETAYANEGTGQFMKAKELYTKVIAADPSYTNAYYRRGFANLGLNSNDEACDDFKKAYELGFAAAKTDMDKVCK